MSSPLNKSPPMPTVPAPEHEERPERMRDWICRMVDSSRFHGLEWINPEKTIFRVPWIHAKKRGYCKERDAALFREWALHSGKYRDESDPTVWKINFRCAINGLKDIMEIKDLQTEDCRVYKVLPSRRTRRKPRRRFPNVEPYGPIMTPQMEYAQEQQYGYSVCAPPMTASYHPISVSSPPYSAPPPLNIKSEFSKPELSPCATVPSASVHPSFCLPPYSVCTSIGENTAHGYYAQLPCLPSLPVQPPMPMPSLALNRQDSPDSGINVDAQHSPVPLSADQQQSTYGCVGDSSVPPQSSSPSCPISPYPSPRPFSTASSPLGSETGNEEEDIKNIIEELSSNTPSPSPHSSPSDNKLDVQVYYGSIPVFRETISVFNGCRIFFDHRFVQPPAMEGSQLFGPAGIEQIMLPECHPNPYAKEIFNAMSRGLIIEMVDDNIYATPLCRPVVYTGPNSGAQSYPLGKENRTKVFDYAQVFRPNLERYALSNGAPPSAQTLFSLGQPWGPQCPAGNISQTLVSVLVTHCKAQNELDTIGLPAALTQNLFVEIPDAIDIGRANIADMQAEEFLTQHTTTVQ